MPIPDIDQLNELIATAGARWSAAPNAVTRLSDRTRQSMLGVVPDRAVLAELMTRPRSAGVTIGLPAAIDWRAVGGRNHVTPVKDQGGCGSCVSFAAVAAVESAVSIAAGDVVDLSEADLHFCSNHGENCGGWWPPEALEEAARRGVPPEDRFPYTSAFTSGSPTCKVDPRREELLYRPTGHTTLLTTDERKKWLSTRGPVVAVLHVYDDFFPLKDEVYQHLTGDHAGYHCVLVVGYSDTERCWIAKNSWGTTFGDGGFFRIGYGECGIDETSNDRDPDGTQNRFPMWGLDGVRVPGGWRSFELAPAGQAARTGSVTAVARIPQSMETWWLGERGSVEAAYWYEGAQWTRYQLAPEGSGSTTGSVTAVSRIPGSMELWWIGPQGSVEAAYWYEGGQWARYQLAPPGSASLTGEISAVSRIPGSMELWWTGPQGSVEAAYWYQGAPWARYQLAPDGSASPRGSVTAVSRIPGSMELWWTGPQGSVEAAYWYDGAPWARYQLAPDGSASAGGGIAAVSRIPGSMELWWTGPQGSVEAAYWYDGAPWARYQVAPEGSASPTAPVGAVSRIAQSMETWWVGADGSLQAAYWYEGGQWTRYSLSPPGASSVAGDLTVVSRIPTSMELWHIGAAGAIHDHYWYP